MYARRAGFFIFVELLSLSGCAVRRYQPTPIVPTETSSSLELRSLADPALRAFLETNLGYSLPQWPQKSWDLRTLSLAAVYFSPALEAVRARAEEAQAAVTTAGARPNPTVSVAPGVPSPYLLGLDFAVPFETKGKRGDRIQSARNLSDAARFDLADSAWKVRSGVRLALLNYILASRNLGLLRSEQGIRAEQVKLLEQRFSVGEISRPEVDLGRIELSKTHLAINSFEGQAAGTKAALAASIGIPVAALGDFKFLWPELDAPPSIESFSPHQVQRDAILNRLDVRRSLARYAAAEADLQLEIARQYPDLQIGPGYTYEERNSFFTIGFSTTLPVFNRNQGPIAEAEARRKQAAAAFLQTQAQVIADSERTLALYTAALKEFSEADQSLHKLQETQQRAVEKAVVVGEEDQLALSGVRIETSLVARSRLDALGRAQTALGELEDAVQQPLAPGDAFFVNPDTLPQTKPPKESNP